MAPRGDLDRFTHNRFITQGKVSPRFVTRESGRRVY